MRFYHAAPKETMMKIYAEGVLKKSWDGVVYMCKDPIDACKFLVIRGMRQMSVIELELDEKEVEESHDHSETFFKCKEDAEAAGEGYKYDALEAVYIKGKTYEDIVRETGCGRNSPKKWCKVMIQRLSIKLFGAKAIENDKNGVKTG